MTTPSLKRRIKNMKDKIFISLFLLIFSTSSFALTAKEIVAKSDKLIRGDSSIGTMTMTVKTPNWKRTLKFKGWSKGKDRMLIRITYPKKEAGSASLKIGSDMWNYLPKINRTIKIPPSMMLQSWMGSDFTNDDIVKESSMVDDYNHKLLGKEEISVTEIIKDEEKTVSSPCYKIESIPKEDAAVVWGKIIYYCRVKDFVPVREEYYSDKGEMIKLMTLSNIKYMHDRNYPAYWKMETLNRPGRYTEMVIEDIKFNVTLPNSIFSLKNLGK